MHMKVMLEGGVGRRRVGLGGGGSKSQARTDDRKKHTLVFNSLMLGVVQGRGGAMRTHVLRTRMLF